MSLAEQQRTGFLQMQPRPVKCVASRTHRLSTWNFGLLKTHGALFKSFLTIQASNHTQAYRTQGAKLYLPKGTSTWSLWERNLVFYMVKMSFLHSQTYSRWWPYFSKSLVLHVLELSGSTCTFFLTCASCFTYNSKIFQPQQILFHCLHSELNPQQLKRALTFANLLVLNSVRASKSGKWFVARDNSSSVL